MPSGGARGGPGAAQEHQRGFPAEQSLLQKGCSGKGHATRGRGLSSGREARRVHAPSETPGRGGSWGQESELGGEMAGKGCACVAMKRPGHGDIVSRAWHEEHFRRCSGEGGWAEGVYEDREA